MTKQTPERKQLKTELARKFHKAAQDNLDTLGMTNSAQWGLARKVVNHAEKNAPTASDASLKKTFANVMANELKAIDEAVEAVSLAARFAAISGGSRNNERIDLKPAQQPPSVSFPPNGTPFRY